MTDTTNPYEARTDESLAELVRKLNGSLRSFSPEDREQLLAAVARRLDSNDEAEPVKLDGSFVFHPRPMVGDLAHPAADNGWLLHGVTYDEAVQIAASLTKSGLMP